MSDCTVKFMTIDQVQKFIDKIRSVPYDVDACHGNYIVDAKSLLGILSLSLGREIKLVAHTDDKLAYELISIICEDFK